jgi:hypothetical protein
MSDPDMAAKLAAALKPFVWSWHAKKATTEDYHQGALVLLQYAAQRLESTMGTKVNKISDARAQFSPEELATLDEYFAEKAKSASADPTPATLEAVGRAIAIAEGVNPASLAGYTREAVIACWGETAKAAIAALRDSE